MLHPILETLFFLKVARESVCESIKGSEVKNKADLVNYIQNEASDYEIMHLLTVGEMPEEKFNVQRENEVWAIFKEAVILNAASLSEDMRKEDIMNIVYEMGPVSEFGYSSAAPILEFDRANGRLDLGYLTEENRQSTQQAPAKKNVAFSDKQMDKSSYGKSNSSFNDKKLGLNATPSTWQKAKNKADYGSQKVASAVKNSATGKFIADNPKASGAAAGAVAAAGLFGLYKLYKGWKAKKAAAKTPEARAAADKAMAKVQAKIKAKKAKK